MPSDDLLADRPVALSLLHPDLEATLRPPDPLDLDALRDLHLDQVIATLAARRPDHDLTALFQQRVDTTAAVHYRQAVFQDLEDPALADALSRFDADMQRVRRTWSRRARADQHVSQQLWHLHAARLYLDAVALLHAALRTAAPRSAALRALQRHLDALDAEAALATLSAGVSDLTTRLGTIRLALHVEGRRVEVTRDDDPTDHARRLADLFARFRRDDVAQVVTDQRAPTMFDHLDALMLERAATLFPEEFAALTTFCAAHPRFVDPTLARIDREAGFYLAVREVTAPLRKAGLPLCYPQVSSDEPAHGAASGGHNGLDTGDHNGPDTGDDGEADNSSGSGPDSSSHDIEVIGAYDLALADAVVTRGRHVVPNDLVLTGAERIAVVSGANQGGKTTFARTIGQIHHLAALGCPVPARSARIPLPDRILTHFARGEQLDDRRGRLQDDLVRIHAVLEAASARSLVITNELFRSTTVADAATLGGRILDAVIERGSTAVFVTFLDELATRSEATVSLVATVDPDDADVRTFRVERRAADGRAYARAIARRHGLTRDELRERVQG